MKLTLHKAGCRGHVDHGWLDTWHTFSFANYYNPTRMHFGTLRVLNDDRVQAGMGFGMHPHENMEIITIVLDGELAHEDSMGNGSVIRGGEIQVMSAGTGIEHSESNPSETKDVSLLQIWVFPDQKNVEPRYDLAQFEDHEMKDKWRLVVSPDGSQNSLWIHQKAYFSLGTFSKDQAIDLKINRPGNGLYLFMISGSAAIGQEIMNVRDGLGVEEAGDAVTLNILTDSKILAMEIPLQV